MKKRTPKTKPEKPKEETAPSEKTDLVLRQEMFCQLYTGESEMFGNGVASYVEAYDVDTSKPNWYKSACASSSRLLSSVKVCERINELLKEGGLTDLNADKQLLFLINQHADFTSKLGAIREYNKLKSRITEKIEHSGKVETILFKPFDNGASGS